MFHSYIQIMLWKRYIIQAFLRTFKKHRRFLEFTIKERIDSISKESYGKKNHTNARLIKEKPTKNHNTISQVTNQRTQSGQQHYGVYRVSLLLSLIAKDDQAAITFHGKPRLKPPCCPCMHIVSASTPR